ncbi:hypothetical protein [Limosilactobacillus kribbianus]|uniref:hypothetical protein n=1 Tax=Limosilactobacillus kribbianus TaxID=2982695 RepID=UPI002263E495|nr:hypothetical protein [Limosilactobacillus kribbianus]
MNKYDSQNGAAISESDAGNIEDYTLADLKDAVYYDITGWILEDGNLDNYPGHRWQMLGIADCDATNSPDPYVGINFSKIDGTHLSIFINPRNEAAQHVILFEQ